MSIFMDMKVYTAAAWMVIATILFFVMIYAQSIIIPFVIALLVWFVIKKTRDLLDRSQIIKK